MHGACYLVIMFAHAGAIEREIGVVAFLVADGIGVGAVIHAHAALGAGVALLAGRGVIAGRSGRGGATCGG